MTANGFGLCAAAQSTDIEKVQLKEMLHEADKHADVSVSASCPAHPCWGCITACNTLDTLYRLGWKTAIAAAFCFAFVRSLLNGGVPGYPDFHLIVLFCFVHRTLQDVLNFALDMKYVVPACGGHAL